MSKNLPFDDFASVVRRATSGDRLRAESSAAAYIGVPSAGVKHFVAPDFDVEEDALDPLADVILISAPAAVGKSSIARELGFQTGSMVWDLSHFSLGSSFFSGTLVDAFGTNGLDAVRRGLQGGSLTMILDAADEALVRAGASNFEAAIDNLVSLITGSQAAGPSAVILGRPETIEETFTILTGRGVRAQIARVAFFNESQARSFVLAKAEKAEGAGVAEKELNNFLTDFFKVVGSAMGGSDWSWSESFLGYAPVLDALGAFYREQENPVRRLSEISHGKSSVHVWDLLLEVIESILDRESEKFGSAFGAGDPRKESFGRAAYSRSAQITLLLSDEPYEVEVSPPDFPNADDSWVFEEMTPQIHAWFQEHPFLRSAVDEPNPLLRFASATFRDYALAASFVNDDHTHAPRLLDLWLDARVAPSPILSRFSTSQGLALDIVPIDLIGMVADSHASGFIDTTRLEIDVDEDTNFEHSLIVSLTLWEDETEVGGLKAIIADSESIAFARSITRTTIHAPRSTIVLGSGSQDFVLGPDVSISCAQFSAEAAEVRVRTSNRRANEVRTERMVGSARRVSGAGPDGLHVRVPAAVFPWQAYRVEPTSLEAASNTDLYWAGMDVRRNFKWYARESMVGGGLNYPVPAMETILNKGRASSAVHEYWIERGYITREGSSWILQLPNISGNIVVANDIGNPGYREMLLDFAQWSRDRS